MMSIVFAMFCSKTIKKLQNGLIEIINIKNYGVSMEEEAYCGNEECTQNIIYVYTC